MATDDNDCAGTARIRRRKQDAPFRRGLGVARRRVEQRGEARALHDLRGLCEAHLLAVVIQLDSGDRKHVVIVALPSIDTANNFDRQGAAIYQPSDGTVYNRDESVIDSKIILYRGVMPELQSGKTLAEFERAHILQTLEECCGNRTHAARLLGISIRSLRNKLRAYAHSGIRVIPAQRK